MKKYLLTLVSLFLVNSLSAQSEVWDLQRCMKYAVKNNPDTRRSELLEEEARKDLTVSRLGFLPSISGSAGVGVNFGRSIDPATNIYSNNSSMSNSYSVGGSLPIFDAFSVVNSLKISKFSKLKQEADSKRIDDQIALQTMQAFYQVVYNYEALNIAHKQKEESAKLLKKCQVEYSVGLKNIADIAEFESKAAADEYKLINAVSELEKSILKLKDEMYYPIQEILPVDTMAIAEPVFEGVIQNYDEIVANSLATMPEIEIAKMNFEIARKNYSIARLKLYPSLSASGGYSTGYSRGVNDGNTYDPLKLQLKNRSGEYVSISLSVPIFDGLYKRNTVYKRKNDVIRSEIDLDIVQRKIESTIKEAILDVESSEKQYEQAEKRVTSADLSYQTTLTKYEEGLASVIDLITTQNALLVSRMEKLNNITNYIIKLKVLNYYKGEPYIK